ncbi:hypothetical protein M405DRAFT_307158 [Rhizopogon salebrosus TDB-379]|nr:hypothetical protein M405DRAFT_307158 [Rhizopogon salebrosus TDB-379]
MMAAGLSTASVATSKTRLRRPPAFACDQSSSSSSSFFLLIVLFVLFIANHLVLRMPSCDFLLPSLAPTYTHPRYLLLRYHHHRNLHVMLSFHLRPQLFSWLMKCAITTIVHGNVFCCQRPLTGH